MRRCESFASALLWELVKQQVPQLTEDEYHAALRYTAQKHHMAIEYIAALVAEAVGQARLSEGTLDIARNDRNLYLKSEGNETA
ncbi:MAG: hypothetical protein ACFWUC_07490 [Oscillospiraceae bacterium]|jgi:membrane-bound lytic murein transglycosylase MltF